MDKDAISKDSANKGERIAKRMARAGLCSRRDAERWIGEGRVQLNGDVLTTPATIVTDDDDIVVDGKLLPKKERTRLFLYNKIRYKGINATLEKQQGDNVWVEVALQEGKNREVRNVMEAIDLKVNRLIRTSYGPFQLGKIEKSAVLEIKQNVLKDQLSGFFKK